MGYCLCSDCLISATALSLYLWSLLVHVNFLAIFFYSYNYLSLIGSLLVLFWMLELMFKPFNCSCLLHFLNFNVNRLAVNVSSPAKLPETLLKTQILRSRIAVIFLHVLNYCFPQYLYISQSKFSPVALRPVGKGSSPVLEKPFISNTVSLACLTSPRLQELMTRHVTNHPVHKSRGN